MSLRDLQRACHHDACVARHAPEVRRELRVEDDGFLGRRAVQQPEDARRVPVAQPGVRTIETVDRRSDADDIPRLQERLGGRLSFAKTSSGLAWRASVFF